jgi:soluble lytic murein transglycosylase-like protein
MTLAEEFRDKRSALHLAQSSGIATRKDLSPQRKLYLVKLAFEAREFSIARRWAEELLRGKGLKPEEKGDLDLLYYRILMRRNLPDSAFAFLSHALTQKDIPPSYQLAFLYRLGLLSEGKEDWKGAERFYFRAVTLAKGSREGEEVLVRLGLIWIQKGETERARRLWEENREGFSPSSEARFLYLIGRAEPSLLGENCRKISNSTPLSYYHFLCSREVPVPSDFFSSFTLPPLRFPKAELLEEIGFFEGSVWEWETYGLEVRDPLLRIAVAQKIHALGFPWTALSFLTRGVDITPWMRGDRRERELWEILYPLPYQEEVITASRKEELDPYLLYAVMRQESRFYPFAQSSANARGLLQLLWETAQSIAEMDLLQVSSPDDLYEPRRNILLGARYLKKLLNRFRGDLYLALASYNAGPARVEEWLKIELPRDLWVERIPIEETRNYVKKVLENYFRYRLLYNPPPPPPP